MSKRPKAQTPLDEAANADLNFDRQPDPALVLDSLNGLPRSCTLLGSRTCAREVEDQTDEIDYLRFSIEGSKTTKFFCSPCVINNSPLLGKVHILDRGNKIVDRIYGKTYVEVDLQKKVGRWLTAKVREYAKDKKINMCWDAYNHAIVYLSKGRAHVEVRLPSRSYDGPQIEVWYGNYRLTLLQMLAMDKENVPGMGVFTCRLIEYRSWHTKLKEMALSITLTGFQLVPGSEVWLLPTPNAGPYTLRYVASGYFQHFSFGQLLGEDENQADVLSSHEQESEEEKEQEPKRSNKRVRLSDYFRP